MNEAFSFHGFSTNNQMFCMMMVYEDRHKRAIKALTYAKWLLAQYRK